MNGVYTINKAEHSSLYVLGDIHGDIESLEALLKKSNDKDLILTLGDYTDRGTHGLEVINRIKELQNAIALMGNHEDYEDNGYPKFHPCTFIDEVQENGFDWDEYFKETYQPFVNSLYIAAILPGSILFVHGGVSGSIKSLGDLEKYTETVLWSDPMQYPGIARGRSRESVEFGPDITNQVCEDLGVKRIIRSHEPRKAMNGPCLEHEGMVITTNSNSMYQGKPFALRISTQEPDSYEVVY